MIQASPVTSIDNFPEDYDGVINRLKYGLNLHRIWLKAYSETFGYRGKEMILDVRDQKSDELVGFLPMVIQGQQDNRFVTIRRFIPCGYRPTDFFPFPVVAGKESKFSAAIVDWFANNPSRWDRLYLNLIPGEDRVWEMIADRFRAYEFNVEVTSKYSYLKLDTTGSFADQLGRLGTKKAKLLRYQWRRFQRDIGSLQFQIIENGLSEYFDDFISIYNSRRDEAEQSDPFKRVGPLYDFFKTIVREYGKKKWIRLGVLKCGETIFAYCYHFVFNQIMYYSMPTYLTQYEKYSPGRVLLAKLIENAFNDPEIQEFNFMRSEYPYKRWWNPERKPYVTISVENGMSKRLKLNSFFQILVRLKKAIGGSRSE